jgi:NAD(P)-dependent dehydrogenase (short-subunit alcohol dehydrogenase family)
MKKLPLHLTPRLFGPIFGRMPGVRDRVAVVTGAANGLGRAIALLLAREGARVALGDVDGVELERTAAVITKAGGTAVTLAGDQRAGPNLKRLNETVDYSPNRMTPLHRLGQPIEVAHAVLFLASEEASYITGHTLAVAGGR